MNLAKSSFGALLVNASSVGAFGIVLQIIDL